MALQEDIRKVFKRSERREARKTLKNALAVFGPNGEHWIKNQMQDFAGNYCALGAIEKVDGPGEQAVKTVLGLVMSRTKTVEREIPGSRITNRNDRFDTTFRDVKRYFQRALEYLAD